MMRTWWSRLGLGLVALGVAAGGFFLGARQSHWFFPEPGVNERRPDTSPPRIAPEALTQLWATTLNNVAGQPQALAQWQGQVLVLNFWATWCPPCIAEIPEFIKIQQENAGNGVQFVGIALDARDAVRDFAAQHQVNYPLLISDQHSVALAEGLGNRRAALPYTVLIDRQGTVRAVRFGALDGAELRGLLQPLILEQNRQKGAL